jgi:hypothetical protein
VERLAHRDRADKFELASALRGTAEAIERSASVGLGVIDPEQTSRVHRSVRDNLDLC